ncbi:hypothetical protein Taro_049394 [Colocasia esculenta]|uniref:Uncharacterized protein n=1 Tax=Colocasia esculenta TaxID=4460 RepID=A0A843XAR2_COLES|nr:hypothetical protein [Colocasia esculenta]
MISSKKLAQMARKWLRTAAAGRKRIAFRTEGAAVALDSDACAAASPPRKGFFVVYSIDGQRFEVPLVYLKSEIFGELLRMSEDVYGLPGAGPITLPCDAASMGSVLSSLRQRRSSRDAGRALLASMAAAARPCSSSSLAPCSLLHANCQLVVCAC